MSKFVSKYIAMFSLKLKRVIKVPITWILIVMRNQLSFFLNNYLLLEKRDLRQVFYNTYKAELKPSKMFALILRIKHRYHLQVRFNSHTRAIKFMVAARLHNCGQVA